MHRFPTIWCNMERYIKDTELYRSEPRTSVTGRRQDMKRSIRDIEHLFARIRGHGSLFQPRRYTGTRSVSSRIWSLFCLGNEERLVLSVVTKLQDMVRFVKNMETFCSNPWTWIVFSTMNMMEHIKNIAPPSLGTVDMGCFSSRDWTSGHRAFYQRHRDYLLRTAIQSALSGTWSLGPEEVDRFLNRDGTLGYEAFYKGHEVFFVRTCRHGSSTWSLFPRSRGHKAFFRDMETFLSEPRAWSVSSAT
jgi:hypothetical protein